jgi:hypothetical protein
MTNLSTRWRTTAMWNIAYLNGYVSANNSSLQRLPFYYCDPFFLKTDLNFLCKRYIVDVFITTITYSMTALNRILLEQNPKWCQPTITVTGTSLPHAWSTILVTAMVHWMAHNPRHTTAAFNHGSHEEIQDWGEVLPCDGLLHYEAQPSLILARFWIGPLS